MAVRIARDHAASQAAVTLHSVAQARRRAIRDVLGDLLPARRDRQYERVKKPSKNTAYLEHRDLAEAENDAERFFMNVVLCRVLYTHALVAAPRMSLGWLRPLAPFLGDPRLGMTGIFLQLSRVLPGEYPLRGSVQSYLSAEHGFGRLVDFGMIVPRLQQLYEWSAHELAAPGLLDCVRDGAMT